MFTLLAFAVAVVALPTPVVVPILWLQIEKQELYCAFEQ
jgi:hypothetical protein